MTTPNDSSPPPFTEQPSEAGCVQRYCSALVADHKDKALAGLSKREMIRLLTLAGIPPLKSEDRRRELMASRLAWIADNVTLVIEWDHRMPND